MSLYNLVHGENPLSNMLLCILNLKREDVPRYRDCYWDGERIVVHTRTGGGNREHYEAENAKLQEHEQFSGDEDDDFDSTYANFYFSLPEQFAWFKAWAKDKTEKPAGERWEDAINKLKSGTEDEQTKRVMNAMSPFLNAIAEGIK